jgi:hypothetical protein
MRRRVRHAAADDRALKLDSSNPFRNLPQSFLIDADGEANITFTGFAKTVSGRCHNAGFLE